MEARDDKSLICMHDSKGIRVYVSKVGEINAHPHVHQMGCTWGHMPLMTKKITFPGSHAQFPNAPISSQSPHSHQFVLKISNKKNTHIGRRPEGWRIRVRWQHEGWFRSRRRRMILILMTSDDDSNSLSKMESPAWVLWPVGVRIVHPPPPRRTPWNCGMGAMTRGHIVQPPPPRRMPWRRYTWA